MWWKVHICCSLYIADLYRGACFRHNSVLSPPPRPARGGRAKELARSIQISPVCSHPSPPASASQSRSYFVLLFCAASPGTQMQSADFQTAYAPPLLLPFERYCSGIRFILGRRYFFNLSWIGRIDYRLPKPGIGVEIQYK